MKSMKEKEQKKKKDEGRGDKETGGGAAAMERTNRKRVSERGNCGISCPIKLSLKLK